MRDVAKGWKMRGVEGCRLPKGLKMKSHLGDVAKGVENEWPIDTNKTFYPITSRSYL